jgi:hypothetical protein
MSEAHARIFSLEWWLTVVFVGLAIHLLAEYLKPHLDHIGGRLIRSWATRNAVRAHKRQLRIELLREDESRRLMAAQQEVRQRLIAIMLSVLAGWGMLVLFFGSYLIQLEGMPKPTLLPIKLLMMMMFLGLPFLLYGAMDTYYDAIRIGGELDEASERT